MRKESSGFLGTIKDKAKGLALALNIARLGGPVVGSEAAHELAEKVGVVQKHEQERKNPFEKDQDTKDREEQARVLKLQQMRKRDEEAMMELREKIAHLYDTGEVGGGKGV